MHDSFLGLGALVWAATGKEPGFSPLLLLNELSRHARYQPEELSEVRLARPVSLPELKTKWLEMLRAARLLVESLPETEVGCLYLDGAGRPVTPDPAAPDFSGLVRHFGSLRGSWPRVVADDSL